MWVCGSVVVVVCWLSLLCKMADGVYRGRRPGQLGRPPDLPPADTPLQPAAAAALCLHHRSSHNCQDISISLK